MEVKLRIIQGMYTRENFFFTFAQLKSVAQTPLQIEE